MTDLGAFLIVAVPLLVYAALYLYRRQREDAKMRWAACYRRRLGAVDYYDLNLIRMIRPGLLAKALRLEKQGKVQYTGQRWRDLVIAVGND